MSKETSRKGFVIACLVFLIVLSIAELFVEHHGHFGVDERYGFYPAYALIGASALFLVSRVIGFLFGRPEQLEPEQKVTEL